MNIFFRTKHSYWLDMPFEQAHKKLKYIINRRFDDYSVDLIGSIKQDGQFRLTNKWGLSSIKYVENRYAYLKGKLYAADSITKIEVRIRPNIFLIALFYISAIVLILELCNIRPYAFGSVKIRIALYALIHLTALVLSIFYTTGLRKKFEQLMQLKVPVPVHQPAQ